MFNEEILMNGIGLSVYKQPNKFLTAIRSFFCSYLFFIFQTIAACYFVATRQELVGLISFAVCICLILIVCEDILPTTLPFLIISCMATNLYDSFNLFIPYIIYAPCVVAAVVFHFVVYKKPMRSGDSVSGLLAVSLAITAGGLGRFTFMEYACGSYYIFGLGLGMVATYFLMKSQFTVQRSYDIRTRFSVIMTLMGLFCCFMIAMGYYKLHKGWITLLYPYGFSRNNLSTMLMFAMPFPLYFSKKCGLSGVFSALFYAMIAVTTSRGGLIFGGVEFVVCAIYWVVIGQGKWKKILRLFFLSVCIVVIIFGAGKIMLDVLFDRIIDNDGITNDARWKMLWQAIEKFRKSPVSGYGILDKTLQYESMRKKGALTWYHMMIPQVFGSMGLVGVVCYVFQFFGRVKLILKKACHWSMVLGLSYLGVLLMSQVNPGEFCPLPFQLLTVLLFILQENRTMPVFPLYKIGKKKRKE